MMASRRITTLSCFALAALCLIATTGCVNALATAVYLVRGNDTPAEFEGLKKKKVVVVVRPANELGFANTTIARDLSAALSRMLAEKVRKIDVVKAGEVEHWADENSWEDPREVGKALGAQMVVSVDLEHFSLYKGQTLFQGSADYTVEVFDLEQGGDPVFTKSPPRSLYPPNSAVMTSDKREPEFRQEYLMVLADEIGRLFYASDKYAYFATDSNSLK